jgi:hypothetical protein
VAGELLRDGFAQRGLVIHDEQMFLALSHLYGDGILTPRLPTVKRTGRSRAIARPAPLR